MNSLFRLQYHGVWRIVFFSFENGVRGVAGNAGSESLCCIAFWQQVGIKGKQRHQDKHMGTEFSS